MLFFCRHGETMYNKKKIQQGRYPSLLTLKGIDQAKSMAYKILDYENDFSNYKLFVSPMIRTKHTMQIIQEILNILDKDVIEEELINTTDKGDYTNIPKALINEKFPDFVKSKTKDPTNTRFPNGESPSDVWKRLTKFYKLTKNEKNMIVVSHGKSSIYLAELFTGNKIEYTDQKMNQNHIYIVDNNEYKRV